MGQDSGEMFDVFLAPADGVLSVLTEPPRPAGFRKARGLVHADGDWHRSVHIWLHNSKVNVCCGLHPKLGVATAVNSTVVFRSTTVCTSSLDFVTCC